MAQCLVITLTEAVSDTSLRKLNELKFSVSLLSGSSTNRAKIGLKPNKTQTLNFRSANGNILFYDASTGGTGATTKSVSGTAGVLSNVYFTASANDTIFVDFGDSNAINSLMLTNATTPLNSKITLEGDDYNLSTLDYFAAYNTAGGAELTGDVTKLYNSIIAKTSRSNGTIEVPACTNLVNMTIDKIAAADKSKYINLSNSNVSGNTSAVQVADKKTGGGYIYLDGTLVAGDVMNLLASGYTGDIITSSYNDVNVYTLPLGIANFESSSPNITCSGSPVFTALSTFKLKAPAGITQTLAVTILTALANSTWASGTKVCYIHVFGGANTDINTQVTALQAKGVTVTIVAK